MLVLKGHHHSTTPVFILRVEELDGALPTRGWVRTRSETETLGLARHVEALLPRAETSPAPDQAIPPERNGRATGQDPSRDPQDSVDNDENGGDRWEMASQLARVLGEFVRSFLRM